MNYICDKHDEKYIRKGKFGKYCKQCQTERWAKTDSERAISRVVRK
jgi:hypothetical protein